MKKKIAILGSTGSIGTTSLKIIKKKRKLFNIELLSANKNYKKICKQIVKFKPRYFVVTNNNIFLKTRKKFKNKKTKILNNYKQISFSKRKIDITIASIPGIAGLEPTINFTKKSKKMLLANKESVICGWHMISKFGKKYKTKIVPIDSEHFSIMKLLENHKENEVEKIYITASGGPFLNLPKNKFKNIKPSDAVKHPKWSMGKKISVDSSTLMNKILELIEAQKMFPFHLKKYQIIVHPQSLVHAIIKLKNGITKLLYHEPDMTIPISNAIFDSKIDIDNYIKTKNRIKNLEFFNVDKKKFPAIKLIPKLNKYVSTPIIINAVNEILVDHFLKKKIRFTSILKHLFSVLKDKNYKKYAIYKPINLRNIYIIDQWSRMTALKIIERSKD
jgi:1-deoxy-D-xylulose-5-phosphate reductoisomerase